MNINMAHVRVGTNSVAIFDADATSRTVHDREAVLVDLTLRARNNNLRVDRAALAINENGRLTFFGDPELVRHLGRSGLYQWTHTLTT